MPADAATTSPLSHISVPVSGAVLAAAGWYTARNDPSAAGSRFPGCLFHRTTGLWCPGCGLTRGVHALLTGHPLQAMGYNVFTPVVVALIVVMWGTWAAHRFQPRFSAWRPPSRAVNIAAVLLVAYGVARNLPVAPLRSLAP